MHTWSFCAYVLIMKTHTLRRPWTCFKMCLKLKR